MKVIHVVPSAESEASGPTYSVGRLAQTLAVEGVQVTLFSVNGDPLQSAPGFKHRVFPATGPNARLCRSPALYDALVSEVQDADLVHSHGMWRMPPLYAQWSANKLGRPLIISPRGCLSPVALRRSAFKKWSFWRLFHRSSFGACRCLHATSTGEYSDIRGIGLKNPIAIVPNGIDIPDLVPRDNVGKRYRILLYLGRLHPIKGLDVLLEAWGRVAATVGMGWEVRVVGVDEGGYRARLESVVAASHIPRVTFPGPAFGRDKWREYSDADVYVLPSRSENFGMTVLESLAAGTPVITTRETPWSALPELGVGWCVDLSVGALADALAEAMTLPPMALAEKGRQGREWAEREFGWSGIARNMISVYEWALGSGRLPAAVSTA